MSHAAEFEFLKSLQGAEMVQPTAPSEGSKVEKEIESEDAEYGKPISIRNLFVHGDSHPVVIDLAMFRAFGMLWLTWEPETIFMEIKATFGTNDISERTRAKIQTVKTLHLSPSPWSKWQVFEKIVQGMNGSVPVWSLMQVPSLRQLYAAIDALDHIRVGSFSDEVKSYMAAAVLNEDVTFVPSPLEFLQLDVSRPEYECMDCGSHSSALDGDGVCRSCGQAFLPEQGLSMRPSEERLRKGFGKNIKLKITHDPTNVAKKWAQISNTATDKIHLDDKNPVDVQIGKLLDARDYMNIRRRQLVSQLTALKSWLEAS